MMFNIIINQYNHEQRGKIKINNNNDYDTKVILSKH